MLKRISQIEKGSKTVLLILYSYTFIRGIGRAAFIFLYPLYIISLGYSINDLGGIATLAAILTILILPVTGYLIDHGWSKEMLLLSGITMSLALLLPASFPNYFVLVISYTLNNLGLYLWAPSRNKIIGSIIPTVLLGRIYSLFIILFNLSRTITPFILGRLTSDLGYEFLLSNVGLLTLLGTLIAYLSLLKTEKLYIRTPLSQIRIIESYKAMFSFDKSILPIILFSMTDSFAWRLWFPLLNAYLKEFKGLTDPIIGDFNTLMGLSMLFTSYIAGSITDIIKPIKALVIYEVLGAIGILSIITPYPLFYISGLLIGFSIAFWVSAYNTLITVIFGVDKIGRLRVLTDSSRNIAAIPAPKIGGYIMSINPVLVFLLSAIIMGLSILPLTRINVLCKNRCGDKDE